MSHNIGSHVMGKFNDRNHLVNNDLGHYRMIRGDLDGIERLEKIDKERLRIAYFNDYLKKRMDFLADVATTNSYIEYTVSFENDIIDAFAKNKILMDRITGVTKNAFVYEICGEGLKNVHVTVPSGVLGCHAFYIILENIIRNIAKHGQIST
uniref:Uncharacterized protein n=1 Tax=Chlorobium phaeobacteroides (strain BS1) TaxID=331678 RepID=B3END1_CHLPB